MPHNIDNEGRSIRKLKGGASNKLVATKVLPPEVHNTLAIALFVCLFVCLFVSLFVCFFVCLFVCLFARARAQASSSDARAPGPAQVAPAIL